MYSFAVGCIKYTRVDKRVIRDAARTQTHSQRQLEQESGVITDSCVAPLVRPTAKEYFIGGECCEPMRWPIRDDWVVQTKHIHHRFSFQWLVTANPPLTLCTIITLCTLDNRATAAENVDRSCCTSPELPVRSHTCILHQISCLVNRAMLLT